MEIIEGGASPAAASRRRGVLLSSATFSQFGASVMQQGTIVLGVFIAAEYHLNLAQMAETLAAMTLGMMLSGLVSGALVDRWGPKRLQLAGAIGLFACAVAISLSPNLITTVALLFVLGIMLGAIPLSGVKAIIIFWPRERRGLPMGVRQMGVPLGALAAALILPTLASRVGFRPLYGGFAALIGVSGLIFCALLPPMTDRQAAAEARHSAPLQVRRLIVPAIVGFLLAWGQYTLLTYTIPMASQMGLTIAMGGALLAIAQVGGATGRMALGAISDWLGGRHDRALIGVTLLGVGLAVALAYLPHGLPIWALGALWLALGFACVGWNALALIWAGERVAEPRAGAAMGLETSAVLAGASLSAPVFGIIVEATHGYRDAWLTLAAVLALAAVMLWTQARRAEPPAIVANEMSPLPASANSETTIL